MKNLLILGAGPAGLSASIYASRYKIDHAVIGVEVGGYMNETEKIENYPGFRSIDGVELAHKMGDHARDLGAEIIPAMVSEIKKIKDGFEVKAGSQSYQARNLIYSIGTRQNELNVLGEKEFKGKGVSYCATCDGPFFKDKVVAVIGGGNSAASASLILSKYAQKVILFYRGEVLSANPYYLEQLNANEKVEVVCCTNVKKIQGQSLVEKIVLDHEYQGQNEVEVQGVFIEIGSAPDNQILEGLGIETDSRGYLKVKPDQSTNVPGFYAAGDITTNSNGFRQIITAAAEGAVAALSVFEEGGGR